jgi:hypothetical protein
MEGTSCLDINSLNDTNLVIGSFFFPEEDLDIFVWRFREFPFRQFHESASIGFSISGFPTFYQSSKQDLGSALYFVYRE